jgi:hypothetical protein
MANIGEISTTVTAKTAPFSRGMKKAAGDTKRFKKQVRGNLVDTLKKRAAPAISKVSDLLGGPLGFVGAIGAAAGALTGFKRAISNTAAGMLQIGKMSRSLGIAANQLSALEFAAGQTGVQFDDVTGALEELNIRIGETIRDRTGPAAEAFRTLGINADTLGKMAPVQRLETLAEALKNVNNEATRGFLADEIFGGDAFKIMPLLREGAQGIKNLTDEARQLGLVFEDSVVKSLKMTSKAMDRFQNRSKGLFRQLTAELYPALGFLLKDLESAGAKMGLFDKGPEGRNTGQRLLDFIFPKFSLPGAYLQRARAQQQILQNQEPISQPSRSPQAQQSQQRIQQRQQKTLVDIWAEQRRANEMRRRQYMRQLRMQQQQRHGVVREFR